MEKEKEEMSEGRQDFLRDQERIKELDKKYPRLPEPDEEGIDYAWEDPRRRFIAVAEGTIFKKAEPLTKEEKEEAEALWQKFSGGSAKEKKNKKKTGNKKSENEIHYNND